MVKLRCTFKSVNDEFCHNNLVSSLFLIVLIFSSLSFLPTAVNAQAPYILKGEIGISSTNYIWITNVKANDEVQITITPQVGDPDYQSQVTYRNLTQIQYDVGHAGYYNTPYGRHNHEFIATEDGNYLLILSTNSGNTFNYTISSRYHVLVSQNVQTSTTTIGTSQTNLFWVNGVKTGELVFITITPQVGDPDYQSQVTYRNLTQIQYDVGHAGYYNTPYGRHNHQFVATEDGDYRLKIWTNSANQFNYTISFAHQNPFDVQSQGGISPTMSPSPSALINVTPTIAPTNSAPTSITPTPSSSALNITGNTGALVTFEVPATYSSSAGNFTYDFGDGKNITTSDKTVTHTYETPGNYVFTLTLADIPGTKIVESYAVTIKNPDSAGGITLDKLVVPIIGGVSVLIIGAVLRFFYGRLHGKVRGNKNKEGKA